MENSSDSLYDSRFDSDFAASVLLDLAQERSLDGLMEKTLCAAMTQAEIARVEIWLIEKGDLCSHCAQKPRCPDQTRCLHLIAVSENSAPAGASESSFFYNTKERIPLGFSFVGRIATTGQLAELRNLGDARGELPTVGSLQMEGIRQCVGTAISFRGEILGVYAIFSRGKITKDRLAWQQIFSDHFGAAIANARAFEEIRMAGKRLEQANQRLELELVKRKQTEEKLGESEQHYRRIVETASEGIWELDEQYTATLVNRRMAEMLGYEPEEMVGRKLHEFLFEDDQAEMSARIAARRQGLTERYEQRYRHKDGSAVWMYVSATSVRDAEHRFLGSFAMLMDITERKLAEEALRRTAGYLAETQRLTHTGTFVSDETTKPLFWSEEHFRIFGFDPQQGLPTRDQALQRIHPEDLGKVMQAFDKAVHGKVDSNVEYRVVLPDGTVKHAYDQAHPVLNASGKLVEVMGTTLDITERKRAFEEIQRLKAQLEMQNAYLEEEVVQAKAFGGLVGQSRALHNIVKQIDLVAPTEASALILGESGTGKELVAREIHLRSRRKDKPLVRVNCASIPKDLFESEFFGHTRGAFTGAVKDRAGRFEAAEGGTIFLDEIGEVPLDLQSKLLRVLQEKSYERVGEDRTRQADVRVIAATNRHLEQAVAAGRFREDLFYRLNVFPIQVPPLRERMEDIPLLAKHFIETSVRELGCPKPRLTPAAIAKLENYHWPGNIRELRNVIERAIIVSRGGALDFDLPVTQSAVVPSRPAAHAKSNAEPEFFTEAELQRRERNNLLAVLEKTHWKIKGADGAAELLGVKPTTLKARIKKLGLKRPN